jgi:hypothetical protein
VYIMETDHLLLQDLPNLAPDKDTVAGFYFPYMDPNPSDMAKVVSRFYKEGPPSDLYATGPSPTILHVDVLKRIVQLWCAPPPPFVCCRRRSLPTFTASFRGTVLRMASLRQPLSDG